MPSVKIGGSVEVASTIFQQFLTTGIFQLPGPVGARHAAEKVHQTGANQDPSQQECQAGTQT